MWKVLGQIAAENEDFRNRLRIRLVGKTDALILDSIHSAGLGGSLENLGYVNHSDAVKEQCKAGVLILPLRKEPEYHATVPGKVFEYIASRRPVLGIGDTTGAMAGILAEAQAGKTFGWDDEAGMENEIRRLWQLFLNGKLADRDDDMDKYSRKRLTRDMAELFDRVLQEKI